MPVGNYVLLNEGPDEPFGGGVPDVDFDSADPLTTGQIMQFNVVPALAPDTTTLPQNLVLPPIVPLPAETVVRPLALIEKMGMGYDADGDPVEGPVEAVLGTVEAGAAVERLWMEPVTENPAVGATEVWEFYNTTGDAHPMHVHETVFEVVNREGLVLDANGDPAEPLTPDGVITPPEPTETGFKDTVTAYPGQSHARARAVPQARPVRVALPHRRARGQRDDAAVPDRSGAAGSADADADAERPRHRVSLSSGSTGGRPRATSCRCATSSG